ncbi:mitochondrial carrier domain-containing protein [Xylaria telfairii]|nr:mitochondrial carrier domain-containing protein [Xylaria telfairii]
MPPSSSSSSPSTNTNSVLSALHHATSGSLGTLISTCSLYPLSLVIARLQVQRQLRRRRLGSAQPEEEEDGHAPPEPEAAPRRAPGPTVPPTTLAPTSLPREAVARGLREPTRQLPPTAGDAGLVDAFLQIWSSAGDGGLRAFYTGLAQDAPKSVLDSFLFFLFYEWFRSLRVRSRWRTGRAKGRGLGVIEELAVGNGRGRVLAHLHHPHRQHRHPQADGNTGRPRQRYRDSRNHAKNMRGERHCRLLEFLKATFADQTYDDPGPRLTFLFAATSKAISSFVTYPFQIAKTRLQAGITLDSSQSGQTELNSMPDEHAQGDRDAEEEATELKPIRAMQNLAQRSIFGMVAQIIRTEGIASLYDGIGAELLKGFFSHGTAMLAKDVVHKLLFKLYIFVLAFLAAIRKRHPQAAAARRDALFRLPRSRIDGTLASKRSY